MSEERVCAGGDGVVFDEISLTLNPELVCHDKNVLIIKVAYVLHLGK